MWCVHIVMGERKGETPEEGTKHNEKYCKGEKHKEDVESGHDVV